MFTVTSVVPSASDIARFWAKVDVSGECWLWQGGKFRDGYGHISVQGHGLRAHRVSYIISVAPIPPEMQVDHLCFNPLCVKPKHLRLVTAKQNQEHLRGAKRNSKTGVRGVSWDKQKRKYRVAVGHNRKRYLGGRFDTLEEAELAARALRAKLFTHDDA